MNGRKAIRRGEGRDRVKMAKEEGVLIYIGRNSIWKLPETPDQKQTEEGG